LDPYRKNGNKSFDEVNNNNKFKAYTPVIKASLGRHIRLDRLFANNVLEAVTRPENGY